MADSTDPQSHHPTLPQIKRPDGGFSSTIPEHLLANESAATQWIMRELSKNSQATEYACAAADVHNEHLRVLNGRTLKNEKATEAVKAEIVSLKEQSLVLTPVSKALGSFAYLWENKPFKVIFCLGMFVIVGIAYPYYVAYPSQVIIAAFKHWWDSV